MSCINLRIRIKKKIYSWYTKDKEKGTKEYHYKKKKSSNYKRQQGKKKGTTNQSENNEQIEIVNPYLLIIILNINRLKPPIKIEWLNGF